MSKTNYTKGDDYNTYEDIMILIRKRYSPKYYKWLNYAIETTINLLGKDDCISPVNIGLFGEQVIFVYYYINESAEDSFQVYSEFFIGRSNGVKMLCYCGTINGSWYIDENVLDL